MTIAALIAIAVAAALDCVRSRSIFAPLVLLVPCALWPFVNEPVEGPTLWVTAAGYRFTLADMITPVVLAIAVARLIKLSPEVRNRQR
jgi:hypothetical protein